MRFLHVIAIVGTVSHGHMSITTCHTIIVEIVVYEYFEPTSNVKILQFTEVY